MFSHGVVTEWHKNLDILDSFILSTKAEERYENHLTNVNQGSSCSCEMVKYKQMKMTKEEHKKVKRCFSSKSMTNMENSTEKQIAPLL